jgi:hypothetical protein
MKRGRPRGLTVNPHALADMLDRAAITKVELCSAVGMTSGHLGDVLSTRVKGASPTLVRAMAEVLGCNPATLAPELSGRFTGVRPSDEPVAV